MAGPPFANAPVPPKELRTFGVFLGGVLGIIGVWPWIWHGAGVRVWALVISGLVVLPALLIPRVLTPVYRGWMVFAEKLGKFNTRLLLGLVFYGVLTPMGLIRGILGKPTITDTFDPQVKTYRHVKSTRDSSHMAKPF